MKPGDTEPAREGSSFTLVSMAIFFNKTYSIADQALAMSNENKKDIAVLAQCIKGIDLSLIRMDLKLDNLLLKK